ncbi:MarR family transcriptional regulator [Planctomycetales bacterium 10988]|nr:MarR family transcriptional regulator [Planctomycetales bacterium 10988]
MYLPRVYYAFLGVVELKLQESGLAEFLQPGMGHVLLRLYEEDHCIIRELAESVQLASGTLTGLLRRMEKRGLIETRRCREDRRAVRVLLTEKGRSLKPRILAFHESVMKVFLTNLTEEELQTSKVLLTKIQSALKDEDQRLRELDLPVPPVSSKKKRKRKTTDKT